MYPASPGRAGKVSPPAYTVDIVPATVAAIMESAKRAETDFLKRCLFIVFFLSIIVIENADFFAPFWNEKPICLFYPTVTEFQKYGVYFSFLFHPYRYVFIPVFK